MLVYWRWGKRDEVERGQREREREIGRKWSIIIRLCSHLLSITIFFIIFNKNLFYTTFFCLILKKLNLNFIPKIPNFMNNFRYFFLFSES